MFKFAHIDMEHKNAPVIWESVPKDDFNLIMRGKNVYEQLLAYSGRDVHEANCAAGNILNTVYNFLYCFSTEGKTFGDTPNDNFNGETFKNHIRKQIECSIERGLKALKD